MKQHHIVNLILLVSVLIVFGCSGGDSSSGLDDANGKGTGTLVLSLTDAPAGDVKAVYITIEEVRVCVEATEENNDVNPEEIKDGCIWEVITRPGEIYNLLELVNGVTETIGVADLPAGTYHQMRLMIGTQSDNGAESVKGFNILGEEHPYVNYLIDNDDKAQDLKVPSGVQSGIKLVREFEITANEVTELVLDFDAQRSIVKAGKKDKYILKPTIKVLDTKHMARLTGTVTDANEVSLEGVTISAQYTESPSGLIVEASTATDNAGGYQLLLGKNKEYTIVVFSNGYAPACILINVSDGDLNTCNFSLEAAEGSRQVTGTITGADNEADVSLSIRKIDQTCGNGNQEIELLTQTIAYDNTVGYVYSVILPTGEGYVAVASHGVNKSSKSFSVKEGMDPQEENLAFDTIN
jgi:hypothetical protein